MSVSAVIRAVLEAHPLEAGDGREAGLIICAGCHRVLGNPTKHLTDALAQVLDPAYSPPAAPLPIKRHEYRTTYANWPGEAS